MAAEHELEEAVRGIPDAPRAAKTVTGARVDGALEGVRSSGTRLSDLQLLEDDNG
jgi:hypothetical protein